MLPDESGTRPRVGNDKKSLGVVVAGEGLGTPDIPVAEGGTVAPGTGGMSVSASKDTLPFFLIPKEYVALYPKAKGKSGMVCWRRGDGPFADAAFAPGLSLRVDPDRDTHAFVEPDQATMSLNEYRVAIAATQPEWVPEPWDDGEQA